MKFVAFERAKQGTGASRRLRNVGKTPGIVYGGEGQPQLIELDHNALWHALKKEAFHSPPSSTWNWPARPARCCCATCSTTRTASKCSTSTSSAWTPTPDAHEGAAALQERRRVAEAVKVEHCLVNHVITELDISCLPADLPEFIDGRPVRPEEGQSLHLSRHQAAQGREGRDPRQAEPGDRVGGDLRRRRSPKPTAEGRRCSAAAADAKAAPAAKGGKGAKAAAKAARLPRRPLPRLPPRSKGPFPPPRG
jgi:large subunit ribosomal protein L25